MYTSITTLYHAEILNYPAAKQEAAFVRPFAYLYLRLLEKKDLYYALIGSRPYKQREINPAVKNKSWTQLKEMAAQEGKNETRTNPFGIIDSEYSYKNQSIKKAVLGTFTIH